jgi:hypothetical protein
VFFNIAAIWPTFPIGSHAIGGEEENELGRSNMRVRIFGIFVEISCPTISRPGKYEARNSQERSFVVDTDRLQMRVDER